MAPEIQASCASTLSFYSDVLNDSRRETSSSASLANISINQMYRLREILSDVQNDYTQIEVTF